MAKIIVIGGGPGGMMAAIAASKNKNQVILLEKNEKLGKKLFITGKGRCNVTNYKDISEFFQFIPTNSNFLYSALYTFTNTDTMNFLEENGVKLKIERGDRVFPASDKSSDIIRAFEDTLIKNNVELRLNSDVRSFVTKDKEIKGVKLSSGEILYGDKFILCTGGCSYPQTGSDGFGYELAKSLGHSIVKPKGALVPIEVKESWVKELQGLSLKNVQVKIYSEGNNKPVYKNFGEMLFTHFGLSGPIILTGSNIINQNKNLNISIDLKPALTHEQLDKRIQNDFKKYCNKDFKNSLDDLLPKKLIDVIISLSGIDPVKKVNLITKDERKTLVNLLKNLTFSIKGTRPIAEAIVTSGGVDVKEVDPSTMKSKIASNLYFAGEILDLDAETGGFNIQIALSTGYLAGMEF
ncbi:NAD(P)/FAD-dependent oxidoreductase [Haloimpatiens lingqiaonensis]|uniref:NAD(P)/FAD-dependent oxidoreductase n=1 Tax=Haloimpatiens lingqiaonensis TaxID=1380675 RepID=UPI0010FE0399|nr:NAD(P)/FAD-dependent oxidoreductase [Haloimpatiens lingqiaonensis]